MSIECFTCNDLTHFGINRLTGEACAFSMRMLCDLSEKGVELMAEYYGLPRYPKPAFAENMNSKVGDDPAVASCMIDREAFPRLMRFALVRAGYDYIVLNKDGYSATVFNEADIKTSMYLADYFQTGNPLRDEFTVIRNRKPGAEAVGSRNIHQSSGRVL